MTTMTIGIRCFFNAALIIAVFLMVGCSGRSMTKEMWKSDSHYYKVTKSQLSPDQIIRLKNATDSYKVIEDSATFYIKKNWIQWHGEIMAKTLATPVTVSLDVTKIIIVGAITDPRMIEAFINVTLEAATR